MPYDYSKLLGRIKEKYKTQKEFANAISLSERTVSLKLSGKIDWRQNEINQACCLLDIPRLEIQQYFFLLKVQN